MEYISEEKIKVPVAGNYDVVICGGGPAGVSAAIAAGRRGAKVILVEAQGCLGGTWTSSLMGYIIDVANKSGIVKEIEAELNSRGAIEFYGDLSVLAGCTYMVGEPETGNTQPMSFLVLLNGINAKDVEPFIGGGSDKPKQLLLDAFHRAGVDPSYGSPTLFKIHDDLFWMMAGRCISGDFLSHSSYRVSGNAAMMGEFAGINSTRFITKGCKT